MSDLLGPESVLAGTALLAARKVLGPALSEVGEGLRRATEFRLRNVGRVLKNAAEKTDQTAGSVPPRIAMQILNEGSYSDDDVMVAYLGGVLAGARTPDGVDDSAAPFTALISRMSSLQLRVHYLTYMSVRNAYPGDFQEVNSIIGSGDIRCRIYLSFEQISAATGLDLSSRAGAVSFSEIASGLHAEGVVAIMAQGLPEHLKNWFAGVPGSGLLAGTTNLGAQLFLRANGLTDWPPQALGLASLNIRPIEGIAVPATVPRF